MWKIIYVIVMLITLSGFSQSVLENLPANTWYQIPGTHLRATMWNSPELKPYPNILSAWNSGAYDPIGRRLLVCGGGMGNYKGNEVYAFSLDSLKWVRLTDPCLNFSVCDSTFCGTPIVRHTYNGLVFINHMNRFFMHDGAWNAATSTNCPIGSITGTGCGMNSTWQLDMATLKWHMMKHTTGVTLGCGTNMAYDPSTRNLFKSTLTGFFEYNPDNDVWRKIADGASYYQTSVVDTGRGLFVQCGNGNISSFNIRSSGAVSRTVWTTTDGDSIVNASNPGFDYDPTMDCYIAWNGGSSVYALNPETKVWTKFTSMGGPARTANGIYGRWRYIPHLNVYIAVTDIDSNVFVYKLASGTGVTLNRSASSGGWSVNFSPNPVVDNLKLTVLQNGMANKKWFAEIFDASGKCVMKTAGVSLAILDLRHLPSGSYAMRILCGKETIASKTFFKY